MTGREFFNTRPRIIEYQTLSLYHPAFGYLRYVRRQQFSKTLGGDIYQPSAMDITESIQDSRNTVSYEIQLGRVGSQVKDFMKAIRNYDVGWMIPIEATYNSWLSSDMDNPFRPTVALYVGNLAIDGDAVVITLETANPKGQAVAAKYNGLDFPGTNAQV